MPMSKAAKRIEQERKRRHAAIRRGMRIALYEVNQALAGKGMKIEAPPSWIDYTVALAEGGRRDAPLDDIVERAKWEIAAYMQYRAAERSRAAQAKRVRAELEAATAEDPEAARRAAGVAAQTRAFEELLKKSHERNAQAAERVMQAARAREFAVLRLFR